MAGPHILTFPAETRLNIYEHCLAQERNQYRMTRACRWRPIDEDVYVVMGMTLLQSCRQIRRELFAILTKDPLTIEWYTVLDRANNNPLRYFPQQYLATVTKVNVELCLPKEIPELKRLLASMPALKILKAYICLPDPRLTKRRTPAKADSTKRIAQHTAKLFKFYSDLVIQNPGVKLYLL